MTFFLAMEIKNQLIKRQDWDKQSQTQVKRKVFVEVGVKVEGGDPLLIRVVNWWGLFVGKKGIYTSFVLT